MEGSGEVMRIRLLFKDENILNRRQRMEGLRQCWMIVKPHLKTVAEIATDISFTFHIHRSCPHGLLLSMDGFTLPSTQPTYILKDKDIVSVHKKRDTSEKGILIIEEASIRNSETLGEKLPGLGGVKLLAPDEFEKEAGGYQSEYEDNETNSKDGHVNQMERFLSSEEFPRKKRKQSEFVWSSKEKNGVTNDHGNSLHVMAEVGDDEHIHKNHKKRKHCKEIWDDAVEGRNHTKELNQLLKLGRGKNVMSDNHGNSDQDVAEVGNDECIRKKHKKRRHCKEIQCDAVEDQNHTKAPEFEAKDAENVGGLHSKEEISWKVKDRRTKRKKEEISCKVKDKRTKRMKAKKESSEFLEIDHEAESCSEREQDQVRVISPVTASASIPTQGRKKSPSRSAKRKKAKRRWLREQKAKDQEMVQKNGVIDKQVLSKSEKLQKSNQDAHYEAEEESLPVVVRPGHIRFLPVDEEYDSQEVQDSMPVLQWNGITTKRQGQNWGKEKNNVNRAKEPECSRETMDFPSHGRDKETLNMCDIKFEDLPSMSGLPQEGDVIAYRLVELSISSWCPELSSFRVGKVTSYDCESTKIRLVPISECPVVINNSLGEKEHAEETGISPYNEDGSLEIDFGSLVDVRCIHRQNFNTNTSTGVLDDKGAGAVATNANNEKNPKCSAHTNTVFPVVEKPSTVTNANGEGDNMSVWEEINQAFNSKKAELAVKKDQSKAGSTDAKTTKYTSQSRSKHSKETTHISKQESGIATSRSFKALRGSALGPTMSFLRSQNIL